MQGSSFEVCGFGFPFRGRRLQPKGVLMTFTTRFARRGLAALAACLFALVCSESLAGAGALPTPGQTPLDSDGRMQVSAADRCPVCAMPVADHSRFACALQLDDDTTYYFCGTGCMIRSWLRPDVFLGVPAERLRRSVVQEYFTGAQVDGMEVTWVAGSDVIGPMGPALVPVKGDRALKAFQRRHGGKTLFRLSDLDDEMWERITGKSVLPR
jgi:nitrous oxide reductase accessory protein NosL